MQKLTRSEQSRINGAKSRGPKTVEGKRRSSQNASKKVRFAVNTAVISTEDLEAFKEHEEQYVRRFQPADPIEYRLVNEIATIDWRLTRVLAMDSRSLDKEIDVQAPALACTNVRLSQLTLTTNAASALSDRSRFPDQLARREAQLIRSREITLRTLRQLKQQFKIVQPSKEILPPETVDPDREPLNEPETNLNGTRIEPASNLDKPASNLNEPKAA